MPINTPSNTIVSAEDPAVYRLVAGQLAPAPSTNLVSGSTQQISTAGSNVTNPVDTGVFTVARGDTSVVDVGAGSGDVTNSGPTNINFATGGNQSVVLASLTTSEINTAVLSNAAVFNTDKAIYITGIDQSTNPQYRIGGSSTYVLPVATDTVLGGVKVGSGLSITGDGTLSATGGGGGGSGTVTGVGLSMPVGFTVSNSPITTSGTLLVTTSLNGIVAGNGSGFQAVNVGSGLSYSANTLSATYSYTLPEATTATLGGVKVGSGLSVASDGTLSTTGQGATYQLNASAATGGANISLVGSDSTVDNVKLEGGSNVTVTNIDANTISIAANIPAAQPATTSTLGSVIVGSGLAVDAGGVLTNTNATPYTLPIASTINLGGVKVGGGLAIDGSGVLSTTYTLPTASTTQLGGVKVDGTTIVVGAGGVISAIGGGGGGGGIANVTASYPLASTGGLTPDISFTGTLDVVNGGTGASTAQGARTNLLPSQSALGGAFLQTNGTDVQWQQIDSGIITSGLGYTPVNKAGDTMTGTLTLAGNPTQALEAATKGYVDSFASGLQIHLPVRAATTATLVATYNNGVSGDGATLSGSGALPVIGGVTLTTNDRVLVKDQADPKQNGVYSVTTLGGPTWIITRTTDFDNSSEVTAGDTLYVQEGILSGTQWVMITTGIISIGASDIVFAQFGGPGTYSAGTGINISGTTISNSGVTSIAGSGNIAVSAATGAATVSFTGILPVSNGGTGANSFTAGAYLKGNGSSVISVSSTVPVADISGTLPVSKGGTGQTSWTPNTVVYASGATTLSSIAAGATGTVLTMFNGAPEWRPATGGGASYSISAATTSTSNAVSLALAGSDGSNDIVNFVGGSNVTMTRTDANTITVSATGAAGAAGVSSFSGGSTGLTPSTAATGTVTLAGTLNISSGGTGANTQQAALNAIAGATTANRVLRGDGTNITLSQVALATDVTGVLPVANGGLGQAPAVGDANRLVAVNGSGTGYTYSSILTSNLVTNITAGTGLSGGGSGGSVSLALGNTAVTPGSYTNANITVDAQGRITAASTGTGPGNVVNSFSGGTTGLTPATASTGTVTLAGTLNIANGGTGQSTKAAAFNALSPATTAGDLIYFNGTNNVRLGVGTNGQVLTVSGGNPSWGSAGSGSVTSVGLTMPSGLSVSGSPVTSSGTLAVSTTLNGIVAGNGSGFTTVTIGSGLSYSGGTLSATGGGGGSGTVTSVGLTVPAGLSVSGSPITSAGTLAISTTLNGIVAGNGSGLTTISIGSGLSYVGNTLSVTAATGITTVSAGTGISVAQSGNTATVSVTTATSSTVGGVKVGSGLQISSDGTLSTSGGSGSQNVEMVVLRYGTDNSFQTSTGGGLIRQTSGVTCTITNAIACVVSLSFTGYTTPPKSYMYYGQNATTNNWRVVPIPSASSFTMTGTGSASNPDLANFTFSSSNTISLTIPTTTPQASGTQPYVVIVIGF